ncbi:protein Diedel-like [Drosophila montana]|uniref:protein Diedel-like n=1 Tax=Drosophila montana TaxID=40370 RepID=UPI00313D2FEA
MRFGTSVASWLLLGILLQLFVPGAGECCHSKTIAFQLADSEDDCSLYDSKLTKGGVCKMSICDDGSAVDGTYCGQGPCNMFGCNCEGGCRMGNGVQILRDFYGDYHVRNVHFV